MIFLKYRDNWFIYYLYFFIFITPWHFSKSQLSLLTFIGFIWVILKYKKEILFKLKEYLFFLPIMLLILFLTYSYISVIWSNDFLNAFDRVNKYYKYYLLIIPLILVSFSKENAISAIKILLVSFSLYAVYVIFIYFGFFEINGSSMDRPNGHIRYSIIGQYMTIGSLLSIVFFSYSKTMNDKLFYSFCFLVTFFALFINHSRTSQVALFLVLIVFLILIFKHNRFKWKYLFLLITFLTVALSVLYYNGKLDRYKSALLEVTTVLEKNEYSGAFGVRLFFNKVGLEVVKENPLLGVGPYSNRTILVQKQKNNLSYKGDDGKRKHFFNHYHSEHIDLLTAYGIIGYSLIFGSIVTLIYKLKIQLLYFYLSLGVFLNLFFVSFATKTLSIKPVNYVYIIFFVLFSIIAYNKNYEKSKN